MRWVAKSAEPAALVTLRCASTTDLSSTASARPAFDQLDKAEPRTCLAREQGWLCAFCMRRIDERARDARGEPTMKIAHRTPIGVDPGLALTWRNLLGSCDGGQRAEGTWRSRTCDAAQESQALTVDPTLQSSVAKLRYERRGRQQGLYITSDDPALREDVDTKIRPDGSATSGTLALNDGDLPELREKAWDAFRALQRWQQPHAYGKPAWRAFFAKWLAEHGAKYPEMLGVVEVLLQ